LRVFQRFPRRRPIRRQLRVRQRHKTHPFLRQIVHIMMFAIPPDHRQPACGVNHRLRRELARQNQPVDKLRIGGHEKIVRSAVLNLLGQHGGGLRYEANPHGWVCFFEDLGQFRGQRRQICCCGHRQSILSYAKSTSQKK